MSLFLSQMKLFSNGIQSLPLQYIVPQDALAGGKCTLYISVGDTCSL